MFTTKNLTPTYLSAIAATLISVPIALLIGFLSHQYITALLIFIIISVGIFIYLRFIFNWFIYRKIKLIYKLIYNTKAGKREETYYKYILPKKSIDDVSKEVEDWATNQQKVLEQMKNNEVYRKEFLQNLSHEFKTPIFALQGYIEALQDGNITDPSVTTKFLNNAHKNVERMVLLVNDLDQISSLETGEYLLSASKFIIQDLIKEVFETLSIKTKSISINTQIKKGCEPAIIVLADKEKIRQVLNNLVENATKYGKKNGNIIAGIYNTDDKKVLVEITDDGIGIAEEHLLRIFERFYRTDKGRSRNIGGTGLGLAICKHIIEAHNQSIHARSNLNVGTTIGFTLAKE
jgi:two-component system, OmpR family, phosphate regulon sensor histidine kinase PhoR